MALAENATLPRWATLVTRGTKVKKRATESVEKDQVEEEEVYLKTRCYHILSRKMDRVFEQAVEMKLSSLLHQLDDFLDMSLEKEELYPSRKRARKMMSASSDSSEQSETNNDSLWQACGFLASPPTRIDPKLLPIALLEAPSFGLDRKEMMKSLFKSLQSSRERTAFVWLQKSNRRRFSWMEELVQQCIRQEPHIFSSAKVRKRFDAKASLTDILILWAQHSVAFDDIVVFLDVEDAFYSAELQDFLCYLAVRRSEYGVPLNVVMLCPHEGRRALDFRSWAQGSYGFSTKAFTLPTNNDIFDCFWQKLLEDEFPFLLPSAVLCTIGRSFKNQKSSVRASTKLKQAIAYALLSTGAFLSVSGCQQIQEAEWPRIACTCLQSKARDHALLVPTSMTGPAMLQLIDEMQVHHTKARLVMQLLNNIRRESCGDILSFGTQQNCSDSVVALSLKSRKDILELLLKMRQDKESEMERDWKQDCVSNFLRRYADPLGKSSELLCKGKITDLLNEFIVLFGHADDIEMIEQGLVPILDKSILHAADTELSHSHRKQKDTLKDIKLDWTAVNFSLSPEPRRRTVSGFLSVVPGTSEETISLFNIAATMFHVVRDRVSIEQGEWFSEICNNFPQKISRQAMFSFFSCGLRYLKICGLISEKWRSSTKNYVVYEKTKLVWCSEE